jgi:peptidoglycan/xylan/chitin deacetylase (PgdA/CDA1 family)
MLFLFTVDTEVDPRFMRSPSRARAIDHCIFGRVGGKEVGISYLMDLLERVGFRGTFFIDILLEYQTGERSLEPVVEAILGRGHDIQLHLHTAPHLRFSERPDEQALASAMVDRDPDRFRRAMEIAVDLFDRRVGRAPVAFRSGAYRITDEFLAILAEFGIKVDSSLYPFKNCGVSPWMWTRTQPFRVGEVLEVPVTWFGWHDGERFRDQQLAGALWGRVQQGVLKATSAPSGTPPRTVVYLGHSYSLMYNERTRDDAVREAWNAAFAEEVSAEEYRLAHRGAGSELVFLEREDPRRTKVLKQTLRELGARSDVLGITMADLVTEGIDRWDAPAAPEEPLMLWLDDARRPLRLGLRRYSAEYLDYLEAASSTS